MPGSSAVSYTHLDVYKRQAVDWLTENGIMQGNAEGDLMLDQPLTRRQFAVLEYRIAKLEGFV